jgi:two-component system, cell cycle sensor histidine kinase and response regulator CckA
MEQKTSLPTSDPSRSQMADAFRNFQQCVHRCEKAVFFTDAAGLLQRVNPAFEQLTGYTSLEIVGKDLSWLAAQGPSSKAYRQIWHEIFENRAFRGDLEVRRKDGSSFQMEFTAIPVRDTKGQITSLVCTGQDMLQEHELEIQLAEARRLSAVAVLARAFAHDLNNLMMVITGCTELALDGALPESPMSKHLQEIRTASQRASELSRDMLAFGSNSQGTSELISINSVVQQTCRILPRVLGRDIQLQVVLGEEIGFAKADVRQVQQVLLNLAINAHDAMPEGGLLLLETNVVDVNAPPAGGRSVVPGKYLLLSVAARRFGVLSEGLGTIPGLLDAIGSGRWIRDAELAMLEEIVKQNQGFLSVKESSGEATVVNLFLPLASPQPQPETRAPELEPSRHSSVSVLLVEDESVIRTAVAEFLSRAGYHVLSAANGKEALAKLQAHTGKINLVITDVVMPVMSGPKLAESIASMHPQAKILFVSGCSQDAVLRKGGADLPRNFLLKPFSFESLAAKVREVLDEPERAKAATANTV